MKSAQGKKIIWAIDPFEAPLKSKLQLLATLQKLSKQQKVVVEPVHVLDFSLEEDKGFEMAKRHYDQYKHSAIQAVLEVIKGIHGIPFLPPRVLMIEDSSPGGIAKALVDYATTTHASLIVAGTHAKHGLPRIFLGSFTETLLLHSQLPVVTVGPECVSHSEQEKMLFATDFDEKSADAFYKVLAFAQTSDLKVRLFHVISHGIEPVLQSGTYLLGGGWVSISDYLSEKENQKQKIAEEWVREGKARGVTVDVHFETSQSNIADLILTHAKAGNFSWIAMAEESGQVRAAVIGSIIRQVVRHASCPVWGVRACKNQELKTDTNDELISTNRTK